MAHGGGRPDGFNRGYFCDATMLTDYTPDMEIMNNESSGPVIPICRVGSFDEALEHANNSKYGLGSFLLTNDLAETMRAINELEAGMTWINAAVRRRIVRRAKDVGYRAAVGLRGPRSVPALEVLDDRPREQSCRLLVVPIQGL